MNFSIFLILIFTSIYLLNGRDQRRRVGLLGSLLSHHQIEKLMERLLQGYMRALDEADPARQAQIWNLLATAEADLSEKFSLFVTELAKVDEDKVRVSKLPIGLPYADKLFPKATFDLRKVMSIHAHGIFRAAENMAHLAAKDKAFTVLAEVLLMQHTCHWFCRSKTVASARMLARHKTTYRQLLQSVTADTRQAYSALLGP